ncbi:DUF418 domain-containing protein [Streptomyces bauhiniae]
MDVLRGFALFGILLVNARTLAGTPAPPSGPSAEWLVAVVIATAVEMKFYLLFSFLFGYSTALRMRTSQSADTSFTAPYLRRLGVLLVLGLCHAVLLYVGDILTTYALLGLALYALRRRSPRTLCLIATGMLAFLVLMLLVAGIHLLVSGTGSPGPSPETAADPLIARYRSGPAGTVLAHLAQYPLYLAGSMLFAPHVLASMLVGLAAGKTGLLERAGHRTWTRRLVWTGLPIGLLGGAFMAACTYGPLGRQWNVLGQAVGTLTAPALTAAYVCLIRALLRSGRGTRITARLAAAGRMSLTHYLSQSLILCLIFTGYGLGLYGRVSGTCLLLGCLVLFSVQLSLSAPRSQAVQRGPVETLVHRLSAGRPASGHPQRSQRLPRRTR